MRTLAALVTAVAIAALGGCVTLERHYHGDSHPPAEAAGSTVEESG